ncbi:hypothetical protein HanXRQr2_Chr09g0413941 [Helianthus annuus]|uniref:Uncharacterized protein n=1 Tax=Helianthus annuus TaxID=4232 RepID=A0A251U055_HELAN|nr:hypothetical protein HanXRQr2_Chr09g0413941 [Helianthus annuus]KAJ0527987.1 hypothetical protein HanHA300_Chr09g0340231 [Helianthus annuus]KAJ0544421.1 hypothetical protein HanHA89_Chr09g0361511 [Helianthus annuus]
MFIYSHLPQKHINLQLVLTLLFFLPLSSPLNNFSISLFYGAVFSLSLFLHFPLKEVDREKAKPPPISPPLSSHYYYYFHHSFPICMLLDNCV